MQTRAAAALTAALLSATFGCALKSEYLRIPVEGAASMLVLAVAENGAITATAYELDGASATWTIPRPNEGDREIYVALYPCALAAHGLIAGPIEVVLEDTGLAFPTADAWLSSANEAHGAFEKLDARPAILDGRSLNRPPLDPCVEFDVVERKLSIARNDSRLSVALPVGPRHALVGALDGSWYDVQVDEATSIEPSPVPAGALAAVARPDGKYYLLAADNTLKIVTPADKLFENSARNRVHPQRPFRERAYFDGFLSGHTQEGYLVGENLEIYIFDGDIWTLLSATATTTVPQFFGLAWYDEHRLIFAGDPENLDQISIITTGENASTERHTIGDGDDEVNAVQRLAPGRAMLGTKLGHLYLWTENDRRRVARTPNRARLIVPLDHGVLFGGDRGSFSQWFPAAGDLPEKVCDPIPYTNHSFSGAVHVGDDLLLLTDNALGNVGDHVAVWLLRKTPARNTASCSR